jgi:arabinosaccharide transport system substrate-binding protein
MPFYLGKPILVMAVIAVVSAGLIAMRPAPRASDLTFWVFAEPHYLSYQPEIRWLEQSMGRSIDMQLVAANPQARRLQAIFADQLSGVGVPDVVEIEAGSVSLFFRPPTDQIGFEPILPMLKASGWYDQVVPSRFTPWTKRGVVFGIPHDVHPVGIVYREDLFRDAGIDLAGARTWPSFQGACLTFQRYWQSRGFKTRHALELHAFKVDDLSMMLLQRGINVIDDYDRIHLADPKVAATIAFYAQCVAGPLDIAAEPGEGDAPLARDLREGNLCALLCADWRLALIKRLGGDTLASKLRFMPLPCFDPTDAPTATWGGTMIGILRSSTHKQEAWKLIEHLYFDRAGVNARHEVTGILPPIRTFWSDPVYHKPDPYFGGQHIDEELIKLADQIPPKYTTSANDLANLYLTQVLSKAVHFVEADGSGAGLEPACQRWLTDAARDLATRMRQWQFD